MAFMNAWLDQQISTIYDPIPECNNLLDTPSSRTSKRPLDEALAKLSIAVAALRRAGPHYSGKCDPFWHFAAGSWSRQHYENEVAEASKALPKGVSVQQDVVFAETKLREAILALERDSDGRDAGELVRASEEYRTGTWW